VVKTQVISLLAVWATGGKRLGLIAKVGRKGNAGGTGFKPTVGKAILLGGAACISEWSCLRRACLRGHEESQKGERVIGTGGPTGKTEESDP